MSATNIKTKGNSLLPMPAEMLSEFKDLLLVQSNSDMEYRMVAYITDWLTVRGYFYEIDEIGNIMVTKGDADIYPCIVAHMDTVHNIHKSYRIVEKIDRKDGNTILTAYSKGKQVGTGGDDKNGIFAVMQMLDKFDSMKAVFFTKEEVGLIGSSMVDFNWFNNVGYILQLDRWGSSDFICKTWGGNTVSDELLNKANPILKAYGYIQAEGLITDSINMFENGIGISAVNISCGYYQHHTDKEYIDVNEFYNSLLFTEHLITVLGNERYEKEYVEPVSQWGSYKDDYKWSAYDGVDDINADTWDYYDETYHLRDVMADGVDYNVLLDVSIMLYKDPSTALESKFTIDDLVELNEYYRYVMGEELIDYNKIYKGD